MSTDTEIDDEDVDEPTAPDGMLTHVTVETDGRPTEHTVMPYDSDVEDIATRWITATENAVRSLAEMR